MPTFPEATVTPALVGRLLRSLRPRGSMQVPRLGERLRVSDHRLSISLRAAAAALSTNAVFHSRARSLHCRRVCTEAVLASTPLILGSQPVGRVQRAELPLRKAGQPLAPIAGVFLGRAVLPGIVGGL